MEQNTTNSKKIIGKVTNEERDEIKSLYERKNGLIELSRSLNQSNMHLFDKIVSDLGSVTNQFNEWWSEKSIKYNWENILGFHWEINFNTGEIFLIEG
jgi:CXXX repeat modification system protein